MSLLPTEAAWLAGLWDGEGSVGVTRSRATGRLILIPQLQLNMTHEPTLAHAVALLHRLGCHAVAYKTTEKRTHHKTSYAFAVRRTAWLKTVSETLLPYAVTKREHWQLMLRLCEARIQRAGLIEEAGWLKRGGQPGWHRQYTEEELNVVDRLCSLNARPRPKAVAA